MKGRPVIRSLLVSKLPKYMNVNRYVLGLSRGAEGLLVDLSRAESPEEREKRRSVVRKVIGRATFRSRLLLQVTPPSQLPDEWLRDVHETTRENIFGFVLRPSGLTDLEACNALLYQHGLGRDSLNLVPMTSHVSFLCRLARCPLVIYEPPRDVAVDRRSQRSFVSGNADEVLGTFAEKAHAFDMSPLIVSSPHRNNSADSTRLEKEWQKQRALGFTGVVIRDPALARIANKVFV